MFSAVRDVAFPRAASQSSLSSRKLPTFLGWWLVRDAASGAANHQGPPRKQRHVIQSSKAHPPTSPFGDELT